MNETTLSIIVVIIMLIGLAGAAYFLDRRNRTHGPIGGPAMQVTIPKPGPWARTLMIVGRISLIAMIASIIGAYIFHTMTFVWVALGLLGFILVIGQVLRFVRLLGK